MLIRQTNNEKWWMSNMLQTFFHARKLVCHEKSHISAHKWKKTELRNRNSSHTQLQKGKKSQQSSYCGDLSIFFMVLSLLESWVGCWSLIAYGKDRTHLWMYHLLIEDLRWALWGLVPCLRKPGQCSESILAPPLLLENLSDQGLKHEPQPSCLVT